MSRFSVQQKQAAVNQAKNRLELAKKQLASAIETASSQLAPAKRPPTSERPSSTVFSRQLDDLRVKATMTGRLQSFSVEVGARSAPGAQLARVSDPTRLKAVVRDFRDADARPAPSASSPTSTRAMATSRARSRASTRRRAQGTVGVDVTLEGALPAGARPDLGIDGTIELERLTNVLYVESPAFGQENSTISLFKVLPTREAVRTPVKIGRRSVQFVEVVEGLVEGDRVVLSDMSQYDSFDRLRLN